MQWPFENSTITSRFPDGRDDPRQRKLFATKGQVLAGEIFTFREGINRQGGE